MHGAETGSVLQHCSNTALSCRYFRPTATKFQMHQVRVATMSPISIAVLLLALLPTGRAGLAQDQGAAIQDQGAGIIEGIVYDPHEAVIVGVWISIENTRIGELTNLRTDDSGRYSASVQEGRYRVSMRPIAGEPFGYTHAPFTVSASEKVIINFRPEPFAISDSIEGGHWIESPNFRLGSGMQNCHS